MIFYTCWRGGGEREIDTDNPISLRDWTRIQRDSGAPSKRQSKRTKGVSMWSGGKVDAALAVVTRERTFPVTFDGVTCRAKVGTWFLRPDGTHIATPPARKVGARKRKLTKEQEEAVFKAAAVVTRGWNHENRED